MGPAYSTDRDAKVVCAGERPSVAQEIIQLTDKLADRAAHLAELVAIKLQSVVTIEPPYDPCNKAVEDLSNYPSLFATLQFSLQTIESSLNKINNTLSRTEL